MVFIPTRVLEELSLSILEFHLQSQLQMPSEADFTAFVITSSGVSLEHLYRVKWYLMIARKAAQLDTCVRRD